MFGFHRFGVSGGNDQHHRPRAHGRSNTSGGILNDKAPFRCGPELFGAKVEAVGRRLPARDVLGGDQQRRNRQARRLDPAQRKRAWRRGHDSPSRGWQRSEKRSRADNLLDPFDLLDLGLRDRCRFEDWIDTGNVRPPNRIDRLNAVDCRQEGLDVYTVPLRPHGPDTLGALMEFRIVPSMSSRTASIGRVGEGICIGSRPSH